MSAALGRLDRFQAWFERLPEPGDEDQDRARWDWYAPSCPCGLAPGECTEHPRARPAQRPPAGDWRVFLLQAGRGAGKTRAAVSWLQERVQLGIGRNMLVIAATASDIRDTAVEGPSGILACAPPWNRPRWEPS